MTIVTVGVAPTAVVIDTHTHRAFVLNRNMDDQGAPLGPGSVSVLDTRRGVVVRTTMVGSNPGAIALDERNERVLVTNPTDNTVSVLDARSGMLRQTVGLSGIAGAPGAVAVDPQTAHAFLVNTADGTVSVVDTQRGVALYPINVPEVRSPYGAIYGPPAPLALDAQRGRLYLLSAPQSPPGYGSPPGATTIIVLDTHRGSLVGRIPTGQIADHVAVDTRTGRLIVTGEGGDRVLDAQTGRVWGARTDAMLYAEPVIDAVTGRALVITRAGIVRVLDERTGRLVRALPLNNNMQVPRVALDERRAHFLVCQGQKLWVLDARRGVVLRTLSVRGCDGGMAVDEQTGYVVIAASETSTIDAWSWVPPSIRRWLPTIPGGARRTRGAAGYASILDVSH